MKNIYKHGVKNLPFVIIYVPDQYKTQKMHDKAILENVTNSESIPDCCKNQEMCDNAVDNYPHELKSECSKAQKVITECCKTQIMCDQAVSIHPSRAKFVLE